ncbi:MAG: TonB-dependent receptor [Sulfuritalea sp.]|nr:TonB-dependent receptor [Sulfuritalea sp.]MDP1981277.1 TonB-dependent receptor [Sulfuritalea sp.]
MAASSIGAVAAQHPEEEDLALVYGDKSTVSLATGSKQAITRAPAVATVITSHDIEAMGAADLDQALESVPGLHVSKSSIGSKPIYSFRGIHTLQNSQVLMLVNGIPITNVFQGDRSQIWGGMPLENVARIEVIRGPGSALYGADAFSGVINVITRTAADIKGTEYGLRAGSFNSTDAWLQHGGKLGPLDAAFYLRVGSTDGQQGIIRKDAVSASGPINEERKAIDARADLSRGAWRFRAAYQERNIASGAGVAGALDPAARQPEKRLYLDLSYEQAHWAPNWDVEGLVGYYDIKQLQPDPPYTLFPAGVIAGFPNGMIGGPSHSERHTHASVSAVYTGFQGHRIRIGAGLRQDDMYATGEVKNFDATFAPLPGGLTDASGNPNLVYLLPHKRDLSYVFVQDEWRIIKDWTLTAGIRHDRYSDFGGTTNPRLALVWDAAYNVVVKAMHGEAFRAPTFVEQYAINNPVQSGSPDIRPETIKTDELAVAWQPVDKLQIDLNLFRYRMRNTIHLVAARMKNAGDQDGRGVELEATLEAARNLRLSGSYSLQHSIDKASGQDAGLAPRRRLFGRADWRFAPLWQLGATVNHVAGRMREPGDARAGIPDYTTVDLTLRREKFAAGWDARVMVTNLFDSDAMEPTFKSAGMNSDLPLAGRAFHLQVQHGF